jgi:arabinofuranosyltransferase
MVPVPPAVAPLAPSTLASAGRSPERLWAAAMGLGWAWAGLLVAVSWPYQVDDAFILFRYGRHLAEGQGLAWNPGGPPVEGYTNLAYVVLAAALARLQVEPLAVAKALGVLGLVGVVGLTGATARRLGASWTEARLGMLALLASPGLCFWAVSGLETSVYAALLWAAVWCFARDTRRSDLAAAGLLVVAAVTRTEAVAWGLALLAFRGLVAFRAGGAAACGRRLVPWLAFGVPWVAFFGARAWYFGHALPNPVLFKSTLAVEGGGESVLWPFVRGWWPWCVLAAVGLWRTRRWLLALVVLTCLPVFATAISDAHGSNTVTYFDRYLLPAVPALVLLGVEPLAALARRWRLAGVATSAAALGWTSFNPEVNVREVGSLALSHQKNVAPASRALADFLVRERPRGYRVALGDVGYVGWRFEGAIDDLYGLNEYGYTVGCKGNLTCWAREVLLRRPDGVVLVMREDDGRLQAAHRAEQALLAQPGFGEAYARAREFGAGDNPWRYVLFERR